MESCGSPVESVELEIGRSRDTYFKWQFKLFPFGASCVEVVGTH